MWTSLSDQLIVLFQFKFKIEIIFEKWLREKKNHNCGKNIVSSDFRVRKFWIGKVIKILCVKLLELLEQQHLLKHLLKLLLKSFHFPFILPFSEFLCFWCQVDQSKSLKEVDEPPSPTLDVKDWHWNNRVGYETPKKEMPNYKTSTQFCQKK